MANLTSNFSIKASLTDLKDGEIATFIRSTPVYLERIVEGSLKLEPISAYHPAFYPDDGAFLLEPSGANLVTYNLDLTQSVWQKGSNVRVRPDYAPAPDTSYTADRLLFDTGNGLSQLLKRSFELEAEQPYVLSIILRLQVQGGSFAASDVIRMTTGVVGNPQIALSELNDKAGKYTLLQIKFFAAGRQPTLPGNHHQIQDYVINQVNSNGVVLVIPPGFSSAANDLKGGKLIINSRQYSITGNTGMVGGVVTITTDQSTVLSDGVIAGMKADLTKPDAVTAWFEVYSESVASVDWGGLDLKQGEFRTSMILQDALIEPRAATILEWRRSPIANLKTVGFFCELKEWRGDGGLFNFGNFKGEIVAGKLQITADSVTITLTDLLPRENCKIFVQVQESSSLLTVYVNGILKGRSAINNFRASGQTAFKLPSDGLRVWQQILPRNLPTLEGRLEVGQEAKQEVAELFNAAVLIEATAISSHAPIELLPTVTIPAAPSAIAQSSVQGVGASSITLLSAANFVNSVPIKVIRGGQKVMDAYVNNVAGNVLTLASSAGIIIGDTVVYGDSGLPGKASVRFSSDPVDPQIVESIDPANKRITVSSTLSFLKARAFVRTPLYQDVAEVIVADINHNANTLTLNSIADLAVGMTIFQPLNELMIAPANYLPGILEDVEKVVVGDENYLNGIVLKNYNPFAVTVTPFLRVYL